MADTFQTGDDVGRLVNLIPVGLKEAAIDSPTARATIIHYGDQVDLLERWLEEYMKVTNRLVAESSTLEGILNSFTSHAVLPTTISEAMLDHDYDVLAMKRYSDGAKDFWMSMVSVVRRLSALVVEPIRQFLQNDMRAFKEARRAVEYCQKNFDQQSQRYASLSKSKEPSSLREEAFQLHEVRRAYTRASLDFFALAPQFRFSVDKLLVKVFCDQWKEMRASRENTAAIFQRGAVDMDRVKGWVSTMEESEKTFRRELNAARKQLEDSAESSTRPSRELEDYSAVSTQYGHGHTASVASAPRSPRKLPVASPEKHGWLYLRTYAGRPTRTVWVKKWSFLRNGVFGWLVQSLRAGGVEESERIGVLLCSARLAPHEDRRFCFEIKTTKHTIVLQAETQAELTEWLGAFEAAKSKALEDPASLASLGSPGLANSDPAFAVSNPPVPEFGAAVLASTEPGASGDDSVSSLDRTGTLPVPGNEHDRGASVDIPRRSTTADDHGTGGQRDHASRIISRLDLHRKASPSTQFTPSPSSPAPGGIASLIAASHTSINVAGQLPMLPSEADRQRAPFTLALRDMPPSTLAPSTLANVPAPTNMSKSAVLVTGERGLSAALDKSGIPNSLLANMWGSSSTAFVNRLDRSDPKLIPDGRLGSQPTPLVLPSAAPAKPPAQQERESSSQGVPQLDLGPPVQRRARSQSPSKRNLANSQVEGGAGSKSEATIPDFPNYYPLQLKTQDAQFRLLFPSVKRDERLVLVFRATWSPNGQQDFPGRIYVTSSSIYFYSNHLGLVLTSSVSLASIDEATAAPGRECDFLFLHMKEGAAEGSTTRITVKTFLEPLRLLQRRINFLAKNSVSDAPLSLEALVKALLKMETEAADRSPSLESWEDIPADTPVDSMYNGRRRQRSSTLQSELRTSTRIDRTLSTTFSNKIENTPKFKLPAQPVKYTPPGNLTQAAEREFDVSPKALFHVMFGDRSALWQLLQHEKQARNLRQGPWLELGEGRMRRDFEYDISSTNALGVHNTTQVRDYQLVDVQSEHLCYVVTDKATPWHLPFQHTYRLVSKIVITHVAKGKCKLAVFVRIEWLSEPWMMKGWIERQALHDLQLDALDLVDLVADQVRKLGAHSRTKKAVTIFGMVGHSTETTQMELVGREGAGVGVELRRLPVQRTLTGLALQGVGSAAYSLLGMLLQATLSLSEWLTRTLVAHKVLVLVLALSVLWNGWYAARDGRVWWQERRAVRFMHRLGVKPDAVMAKAVYLQDIEALLAEHLVQLHGVDFGASQCYQVFAREGQLGNLDVPLLGGGASGSGSGSTAARIQRTRRDLGVYRHDLLVAMRMVNSVEREVVRSEWEAWVDAEGRRCRQVEALMQKKGKVNETQLLEMGLAGGGNGDAGEDHWFDGYCKSCRKEHENMRLIAAL
jgi:hypothetical protein